MVILSSTPPTPYDNDDLTGFNISTFWVTEFQWVYPQFTLCHTGPHPGQPSVSWRKIKCAYLPCSFRGSAPDSLCITPQEHKYISSNKNQIEHNLNPNMENNPFPVEYTNLQGLGFAKVPLCGKTHWIHIITKKKHQA